MARACFPLPLSTHTLCVGAHRVSLGVAADRRTPARELRGCTLPTGPVASAGSLSQPICPLLPDSTLTACVTARLLLRAAAPWGSGRKTPKPEPEEAGWWWEPFLRLPVPHTMWQVPVWAQRPSTVPPPLLSSPGAPGLCWRRCGRAILPPAAQGGVATLAPPIPR